MKLWLRSYFFLYNKIQIGKNHTVYYGCALSSRFFLLLYCLNLICLKLLNSICYKFAFFCFCIIFGLKFFLFVMCLPYWGFWWSGNGQSLEKSSIYSLIHWSRTEFYILLMKEWSSKLYNASKIIYPCFLLCINLKLCLTVLFFPLSFLPPHFLWLHLCCIILDHV